MGKLTQGPVGRMWCATFKKSSGDMEEDEAASADGSNSKTLRFSVESSLVQLQEEVGQKFGWAESAVLYQLNHHGWEIPLATETQVSSGASTDAQDSLS